MKGLAIVWLTIISVSMAFSSVIATENFIPVGCYHDKHNNDARPLPKLVANYRGPGRLDWNDLYGSVVKPCAKVAIDMGFEYFGVQFYGECWSGPHGNVTYNIDGESDQCVGDVGKEYALMVYKKITTETECATYKTLGESDRAVASPGGDHCDLSLQFDAWYRFSGEAGISMAHSCTLKNQCGSLLTGWLHDSPPSVREGIVDKKVCLSSRTPSNSGNCCSDSKTIKVRNCGKFYVYGKLRKAIEGCPIRFCGSRRV